MTEEEREDPDPLALFNREKIKEISNKTNLEEKEIEVFRDIYIKNTIDLVKIMKLLGPKNKC